MDRGRLLVLSGQLNEGAPDGPETIDGLKTVMASLDTKSRTGVISALTILQGSGRNGLTPLEWSAAFQQEHPDLDSKAVLRFCVQDCSQWVERSGASHFVWASPAIAEAVDWNQISNPVETTSRALALMSRIAHFTPQSLAESFEAELGLSADLAKAFASHMIAEFKQQITKTPTGMHLSRGAPKAATVHTKKTTTRLT